MQETGRFPFHEATARFRDKLDDIIEEACDVW